MLCVAQSSQLPVGCNFRRSLIVNTTAATIANMDYSQFEAAASCRITAFGAFITFISIVAGIVGNTVEPVLAACTAVEASTACSFSFLAFITAFWAFGTLSCHH
jgi:hypothetical protein